MNHLNIFLCLLYIVFSIIIDFILVYLYIKNVKIQKFLISNYFKYMILSSTLSILDGLTIIINKIQNYELYILIKFNMVYTINLSLMLIYSYRIFICYYNCKKIDNNNIFIKNIKSIKRFIIILIIVSILYIVVIDILNKYYNIINIYYFYPYFLFTLLWISSYPFLILLVNKTNNNIRNEYIITFSILLIMLILFILSDYSIINSIFIIKYWNVITNIIIGFIWLIPVFKLKHEKNNINNNIVDNVFDIRYLNNNITDEEKLYYEIYENKFKE